MNWLTAIGSVIGWFWSFLFKDVNLTNAIRHLHAMTGMLAAATRDNNLSRLFAAETAPCKLDRPPVRMLLEVASAARESDLKLDSASSLSGSSEKNSWTLSLYGSYTVPDYITVRLFNAARTLLKDHDYSMTATTITLKVDPSTLGMATTSEVDALGVITKCYICYGWSFGGAGTKDAIASMYGKGLEEVSDVVWRMHVRGASKLDAELLLAWASGSVVCRKSGYVEHSWTECVTLNCITVNGITYCSTLSLNALPSDGFVPAGFVLFGSMRVYDGKTSVPTGTSVPSFKVMTDAGEVTLPNSTVSSTALTDSGTLLGYALGVTGDNASSYNDVCKAMFKDTMCPTPVTAVAATQNPFTYVAATLRRGRCMFVTIGSYDTAKMKSALEVLEKEATAAGIINIYASVANASVNVSLSASGGLTA